MEIRRENLFEGQPMGNDEFNALRRVSELDATHGNLANINVQDNLRLVNRVLTLNGQEPIITSQPLPELTDLDLVMILDHSLNNLNMQPDKEILQSKIRLIAEIRRIQVEQEKKQK